MKNKKVIQVFVGSPGDVSEERQQAFRIIDEINKDNLIPDGWSIEGIGWDQTPYPRIAWLSPQEAINQGIPLPGECDIAVFIFWKRIGTRLKPGTFDENGAGAQATGSLWEFHHAMESKNKPWVLVYYCNRPPVMDETDMKDPAGFGLQVQAVQELKARFKDDAGHHVSDKESFSDKEDFAKKLAQDLKAYIKRQTNGQVRKLPGKADERTQTELVPAIYLNRLKKSVSHIELLGLDLKESITNGLPQVYVPAMTVDHQKKDEQDDSIGRDQHELILQRLGEQSLYLPGDPGSGKSTFTQWVTYLVAHGEVPENIIAAPQELQEQLPDSLRGRLPLLIRLRDFWGFMDCGEEQGDWTQKDLEESISCWLDEKKPHGLDSTTFERNLKAHNLLLIFDGVDEVPETYDQGGHSIYPRHALITGLADALPQWCADDQRILVTSRPYGLESNERDRLGLREAVLLALTRNQQQLFIERWFATADFAEWQDNSQGLVQELDNRGELAELRSNPLLLTALCVKYKEGKRLPHDIYQLYDSVVNQVLYNRFRRDDKARQKARWRLEAVALGMHYGIDKKSLRSAPLASVSFDELDRILASYAKLKPSTEGDASRVLERRNELLEYSGLLLPRAEGQAEFFHQDFRDFLAAIYWLKEAHTLDEALAQRGADRDWRRMLSFMFARAVEDSGGIDRPLQSLDQLREQLHRARLQSSPAAALVLADCLEIAAGRAGDQGLPADWKKTLRQVCDDSLEVVDAARDRNELWLTLGRMGWDDRRGVGLDADGLPDIDWLPVGSSTDGPKYYLARYPVTQIQFEAFIKAEDGYTDPRWWTGLERTHEEPSKSTWPEPNVPRTDVDWFEAVAFCRWMTFKGYAAENGMSVSLPTDEQWRRAYVGDSKADFPWQGETDINIHANCDFALRRTNAVGLFPAGEAVSGGLDMAGNVWEWCLNEYDNLDNISTKGNVVRVLRGGSWSGTPDLLRSAFRFRYNPDLRNYDFGFRVVCRPHLKPLSTDP